MQVKPPTKKRVCTVDTETPPFEFGAVIKPFSVGFFDGQEYYDFWGDDCVKQYFEFLASHYGNEELLIYAHNGGGFDFFFFMDYVDETKAPVIIRGRMAKMWFQGREYRDSYKIIPTALSGYKKDEIDYQLFRPETREAHKREILKYLRSDCIYLYELVARYQETFGDQLTIGGTSIKVLSAYHPWEKLSQAQDARLRPYYFGGRNQCFEAGIKIGKFKVYDVNSMYPFVMQSMLHPVGKAYPCHKRIREDKTAFVCFEGENGGALPMRGANGGLDFTATKGRFFCSLHEFNAGLETNTIRVKKILHTVENDRFTTFAEFINTYYDLRLIAKAESDAIYDLFYKLLMNNSYGKFAQDPADYKDYAFSFGDYPEGDQYSIDCPNGWRISATYDIGDYPVYIWERPAKSVQSGYKNVGTAASITGGSRAVLLQGLASARRPLYCDTDSIICESLSANLDDKNIGGWKLEAELDAIAVAGKKMYVGLTRDYVYARNILKSDISGVEPTPIVMAGAAYYPIKKASKGARLSAREIIAAAMGDVVRYENPVPKFKMDGSQQYISRRIKRTAGVAFVDDLDYGEVG